MHSKRAISGLLSLQPSGHAGYVDTDIKQVKAYILHDHQAKCPMLYDSGLFFVLQGAKKGFAAGQTFATSAQRYLLLSNAYPIECETLASPSEPIVGLFISLDKEEVARQIRIMGRDDEASQLTPMNLQVINSIKNTHELAELIEQLALSLIDPSQAKIIGPSLLTQIYYHVLQGPGFQVLRQWVNAESKFSAISKAIEFMQLNLTQRIHIDDLAEQVGLSGSGFHRYFKQVTGESPLQYLKQLRLVRAKALLVQQKQSASQTAYDVGYESPNQFSREFKRYFGVPPSKADTLPYR